MRTVEGNDYVLSMSMRASAVKNEIKKMADVYVGRVETQLVHWGARIDKLVAHADAGGSDVQIKLRNNIATLESKYRTAQTKLVAWKTVGGGEWGTHKFRVEEAWSALEGAVADLKSGFAARD